MTSRHNLGQNSAPGAAIEGNALQQKPSFNPEVPSIARTYDYLLGGCFR
jgi:hypothetical protein